MLYNSYTMKKRILTVIALASFMSFGVVNKVTTVKVEAATVVDINDYSTADALHESNNASGLLAELRNLTAPGKPGSYDALWTTYGKVYTRPDGKIFDYYSKVTNYDPVKDRAGNYKKEGDVFNREHSIPKDWWGGSKSNQGADPFIVVPTDGFVNNQRSSYSFGMVDRSHISYAASGNFALLGTAVSTWGYSGKVFEPDDSLKGDFARIMFYSIAKYSASCGWTSGYGSSNYSGSASTNFGLKDYAVKLFSYWSNLDPVSDWERKINDGIADIQGNRNPFIDHPEYANTLWGSNAGYTPYAEEKPELDSITVDSPKTEYLVGDQFVKPTVTAHYVGGKTKNVTGSASFTGFDSTTTGEKTINVSYTENEITKNVSYTVTVSERPAVLLELTVSTQNITINTQETAQITYSTNKEATVTWSIDDSTVASLRDGDNSSITISPLKEGNATITITASTETESTSKTISVTVSKTPEPVPPAPAPKGCGGNVATTSIVLSSLAFAGIITTIIVSITRKKRTAGK